MVADPNANPVHYHAARLNHLGMLYAGAIAELAMGQPVAMLPQNYPGLHVVRDLLQLILFTRAEINAVTKLLLAQGVTQQELDEAIAAEYQWFAETKARQFGVKISDLGLEFDLHRHRHHHGGGPL